MLQQPSGSEQAEKARAACQNVAGVSWTTLPQPKNRVVPPLAVADNRPSDSPGKGLAISLVMLLVAEGLEEKPETKSAHQSSHHQYAYKANPIEVVSDDHDSHDNNEACEEKQKH